MSNSFFGLNRAITMLIAVIWLINGLYCKVLGLLPRHQQIVARVLGSEHAAVLTKAIGLSEILMAVWILSGFQRRINAVVQMAIIAAMNCIEFIYARDLLLFGGWNAVLAGFLIIVIYLNEFMLREKT